MESVVHFKMSLDRNYFCVFVMLNGEDFLCNLVKEVYKGTKLKLDLYKIVAFIR